MNSKIQRIDYLIIFFLNKSLSINYLHFKKIIN